MIASAGFLPAFVANSSPSRRKRHSYDKEKGGVIHSCNSDDVHSRGLKLASGCGIECAPSTTKYTVTDSVDPQSSNGRKRLREEMTTQQLGENEWLSALDDKGRTPVGNVCHQHDAQQIATTVENIRMGANRRLLQHSTAVWTGRDVRKFVKNYVRSNPTINKISRAEMDKILPKESEREIQVTTNAITDTLTSTPSIVCIHVYIFTLIWHGCVFVCVATLLYVSQTRSCVWTLIRISSVLLKQTKCFLIGKMYIIFIQDFGAVVDIFWVW